MMGGATRWLVEFRRDRDQHQACPNREASWSHRRYRQAQLPVSPYGKIQRMVVEAMMWKLGVAAKG